MREVTLDFRTEVARWKCAYELTTAHHVYMFNGLNDKRLRLAYDESTVNDIMRIAVANGPVQITVE